MSYVDDVLAKVIAKNPSEPEFHQAVTEVFERSHFDSPSSNTIV